MLNKKIVDMFFEIENLLESSYMYSAKEVEDIFIDIIVELDLLTVQEAVKVADMIKNMKLHKEWSHSPILFQNFKEDVVNCMQKRYDRSSLEDRVYMVKSALGIKDETT